MKEYKFKEASGQEFIIGAESISEAIKRVQESSMFGINGDIRLIDTEIAENDRISTEGITRPITFVGCSGYITIDGDIEKVNIDESNVEIYIDDLEINDLTINDSNISRMHIHGNKIKYLGITNLCVRKASINGNKIREGLVMSSYFRYASISDNHIKRRLQLMESFLFGADMYLTEDNMKKIECDERTVGYAMVCPEEGSFVGYKKCVNGEIVTLLIPEDAERSSATSHKCRCSKAVVLKVEDANGNEIEYAVSPHGLEYEKGKTVYPDEFDKCRWHECSNGIHFFMNKEFAKRY